MRGHVYRRGSTWTYVVDREVRPDGARKQTSKGGYRTRKEAEAALGDDAEARPVLLRARGLADLDRARVAVVGDYSSGKTTFLRRLLAEDYRQIPKELQTGGARTTATATDIDHSSTGSAIVVGTPR